MDIFQNALDLLIPNCCLICGKKIAISKICLACSPETEVLKKFCYRCHTPLFTNQQCCEMCKLFPPVFRIMRYVWEYHQPNAAEYIGCMKYAPSLNLCKLAGKILSDSLDILFPVQDWDLIVPIPGSKQSINRRLFNQCIVMAKQITRSHLCLQKKLNLYALKHCGYKEVQASLSHQERLRNVKGVFKGDPGQVEGKIILLIEDVVTTGATSNHACLELLRCGAEQVDVLTLSRSEIWNEFRGKFISELFI